MSANDTPRAAVYTNKTPRMPRSTRTRPLLGAPKSTRRGRTRSQQVGSAVRARAQTMRATHIIIWIQGRRKGRGRAAAAACCAAPLARRVVWPPAVAGERRRTAQAPRRASRERSMVTDGVGSGSFSSSLPGRSAICPAAGRGRPRAAKKHSSGAGTSD